MEGGPGNLHYVADSIIYIEDQVEANDGIAIEDSLNDGQ